VKRASGEWSVDEPGVCYEVYELEDRAGHSFIFEKGDYDGFSPEGVETYTSPASRALRLRTVNLKTRGGSQRITRPVYSSALLISLHPCHGQPGRVA
jgi:hypothetical protein